MKGLALTALLTIAATQSRGEPKPDSVDVPSKADPEVLANQGFHPLFDGTSLQGWKKVGGTGQFKVEDQTIVGFGKNIRGNTFLCTEKTYADFILIFQFHFVDPAGNSGVQFRSEQRDGDGRVFGYQCEHDNNKLRAYTAGVYDESRRGWLYPGVFSAPDVERSFTTQGQDLFKWDTWNTVVVRCKGRRIQTWLNGVARADFEDTDDKHFTAKGFIGLQVHGGRLAHVRWRHLFLKEL